MVVLVTAERRCYALLKNLLSPNLLSSSFTPAIVFWDVWMNAETEFNICKGMSLLCYVINHFNASIFW